MKKMDLVSSTLDKYLKHRFNGIGIERVTGYDSTKTDGEDTPKTIPAPTDNSSTPAPETEIIQNLPNQISDSTNSNNLTESAPNESHDHLPSVKAPLKLLDKQEENNSTSTDHATTNGVNTEGISKLPTIYNISISNNRPCCVTIRRDMSYLAAGFENSHIYLWSFKKDTTRLETESMFTLLAHSGSVYSIQFFDSNDLMLSCSEDTTIRLWCLKTKCNVSIYRGHNYPIWSLDVGSQGQLFASASMDATARLWRIDRMTPLRIFCGHHDDVECVKFHPNEKYVASGSSDTTVRLWSISDGKMVRLMVGHKEPITSLSFLPDGKFLASASRDGMIKVWNLATNSVTSELSIPVSFTISFSPEQKFVSSCGIDNVLRLWQVDKTDLIERKKIDFRAQGSKLIQSHFCRDNELFIIGYVANEKVTK